MSGKIIITQSIENLFTLVAREVVGSVKRCRQEERPCSLALAGGSTPRGLYQLLAGEPYRSEISWEHLQVFWGDERSVPPDHQDSNFRMAEEALLAHVPIPAESVFRMEGELPAAEAAKRYEDVLREQLELSASGVPRLDLVLLGMGPDAHTASLFPETSALTESEKFVAAPWVEKFQTHRITLTPSVLNAAHQVIFLVGGKDKALALQSVLEGPRDINRYPSQVVNPTSGNLIWFVNEDAANLLSSEVSSEPPSA